MSTSHTTTATAEGRATERRRALGVKTRLARANRRSDTRVLLLLPGRLIKGAELSNGASKLHTLAEGVNVDLLEQANVELEEDVTGNLML